MALVNLPNELDKLYRAPFASFPSFKYRSKKKTAAEKHLTGDDRGQAGKWAVLCEVQIKFLKF